VHGPSSPEFDAQALRARGDRNNPCASSWPCFVGERAAALGGQLLLAGHEAGHQLGGGGEQLADPYGARASVRELGVQRLGVGAQKPLARVVALAGPALAGERLRGRAQGGLVAARAPGCRGARRHRARPAGSGVRAGAGGATAASSSRTGKARRSNSS
jgi:hypothetical protein